MPSPLPRRSRPSLGWIVLVAALAAVATGSAYAQVSGAPLSVTVAGKKMSSSDVATLSIYPISCGGAFPQPLQKPPAQMPSTTPYVSYAGKNSAGVPAVWVATASENVRTASDPVQRETHREWIAACLLETLDAGKGSAAWQSAFATVKDRPDLWPAFGRELTDALRQMSAMYVAKAGADRTWLFKHLPAGTTRSDAYRILRSRGLAQKNDVVSLPGGFEPGCYTWTDITITFDASDRIYKMDLKPVASCL